MLPSRPRTGRHGDVSISPAPLVATVGTPAAAADLSPRTHTKAAPVAPVYNWTGWYAGAGVEWAFQNNWTLRGEYLYYDLGSVDHVLTDPTAPNAAINARAATRATSSTRR